MAKALDERNIPRYAEFIIRIKGDGCSLYKCSARLSNCNTCLWRFKCFTSKKAFPIDAKTDPGLLFLREKFGLLWGQHLAELGCGGARVEEVEKYAWGECSTCNDPFKICKAEEKA